jgi:hypothetical protein
MVGTPPDASRPPTLPTLRDLLHRKFRLEAVEIAVDRGDREHAAAAFVFQQAIFCRDFAVDCDLVPLFGMADLVDRHVVVLAPEKRHRVECLARAEHVARGGLALAFGHHPMLDPDILL